MCEEHKHSHETENHKTKEEEINISIDNANIILAEQNKKIFTKKKIFAINIMGSPGSGKTTIIEGLYPYLKKMVVIQGDLESDVDKKRLEKLNIKVHQINTHSGCHLNANMINESIMDFDFKDIEFLIIENVGNLVCPAGIKIGQVMNLLVSSTTEGTDKPKKYPLIFRDSDMIIVSKYDLKEYVDFDEKEYIKDVKNINGLIPIYKVSKKDNETFKKIAHDIIHKREHMFNLEHKHH
jgi:hydrogenase nickel incorporation protein HypB